MDFRHSEDRRMLADSLNKYVANDYGFEARMRSADAAAGFDRKHWQQLADIGAIGALLAEADGGLGGQGFDLSVVFEALGRGLAVEPFLGTLMAASVIARGGSAAQREQLPSIIDGSRIVALAHGEPESGYALAEVSTTARREGNAWVLDGAKCAVAQAEAADAFVVSARTGGAVDAQAGISLFLLPASAEGLRVQGYPAIDGGRVGDLHLRQVRVGAEVLIGPEGAAYPVLEQALGRGVLALCAEALGAMDVVREQTLEYLRTRKQFGVALGSFQALQHRMADLLLEIEQGRSALINAAAAVDGDDRLARELALSAAKATIGRVGTLAAEECIQLHGGIGMTWELPLAHYAKRLVMIDHQLGDEDFHLARYVALSAERREARA
ncbi:MAG: acyl-CoA dehydrogenase family protein [Proteobacteria bacterium]|nr:acyl-CoA dehydrogenase family protein [Pseudomonadota bacterium]